MLRRGTDVQDTNLLPAAHALAMKLSSFCHQIMVYGDDGRCVENKEPGPVCHCANQCL